MPIESVRDGWVDTVLVKAMPNVNEFWWTVMIPVGILLLWAFRRMRVELQARDE